MFSSIVGFWSYKKTRFFHTSASYPHSRGRNFYFFFAKKTWMWRRLNFAWLNLFLFCSFVFVFQRKWVLYSGIIKTSTWIYTFIKPLINVSFLRFWETFPKKERNSILRNLIFDTLTNFRFDWVKFAESVMRINEVGERKQ